MHPHHHDHGHDQSHGHEHDDIDWSGIVDKLVMEGEVLLPLLDETLDRVAALSGRPPDRIVDVGCGPGVATCALAERFPAATVLGIDSSEAMLERAAARAALHGVADRVELDRTDLDDPMEASGDTDLIWASMVLHHIGDEVALLTRLAGRLAPGGLLALIEFGDPMRYLPDGPDGLDGFQARFDAAGEAWLADMRAGLPGTKQSDEHPAMLAAAGFDVLDDRLISASFPTPLSAHARQVIVGQLLQRRQLFAERADAPDRAVLDTLLDDRDPAGIMRRDDVFLELSRRVLIARRR